MQDVIYLAGCAVNEIVPAADRIKSMNLDLVYAVADRHMLKAVIAMALESAGVKDVRSAQAIAMAMRRTAILDAEKTALLQRLEAAGIWYMPLKGAVLKDDYPKYGMRQMADYDFLFDADRAEDVKGIMEELGFYIGSYGKSHHDAYYKKPVCNFEMHRVLFGSLHEERLYNYYFNIKNRLLKDEGNNYGYHFSPEDFYLYITAHEYKHFIKSGTGLRSLLDSYVFLKKYDSGLNWNYIRQESEKLGFSAFENKNRNLAVHLFSGKLLSAETLTKEALTEETLTKETLTKESLTEATLKAESLSAEEKEMLGYMFFSGTHGTFENYVNNSVERNGGGVAGKLRYLQKRLFLPMDVIKVAYPVVYEHKLLLPLFVVWRIGKGVLLRSGRIVSELRFLLGK